MHCVYCSNQDIVDREKSPLTPCARCAVILSLVTGGENSLRPDKQSINTVLAALEGVDKNDDSEVWAALIAAGPSIGDIPALKLANKTQKISRSNMKEWKVYYNEWDSIEATMSHEKLPLPNDLEMSIRVQPDLFDDPLHYWCKDPLADLAEYFISRKGRVVAFENWSNFISLLSSSTQFLMKSDISAHAWFQTCYVRCIPPIKEVTMDDWFDPMIANARKSHPFIRHVSKLTNDSIVKIFCIPDEEHMPKVWGVAYQQLGDVVNNWKSILENRGESARAEKQGPALVVQGQRLHLVVRKKEGYSLKSLPVDMHVWRHLLAWSLYHPSTEQNRYLRAIQWAVDCDIETKLIGPEPEFRALKLLNNTYEALGESVSISKKSSFIVEGMSSLCYSIKVHNGYGNYGIEVEAYRGIEEALIEETPIKLCIHLDHHLMTDYPLADKIATFLLTLRNDLASAENVSTIGMLHYTWLGKGGNRKCRTLKKWKKMAESKPQGFQEDGEDWDDAEWPDELGDEWPDGVDHDDAWVYPHEEIVEMPSDEQVRFFDLLHSDSIEIPLGGTTLQSTLPSLNTDEAELWKLEAEARGETHCT